MNEPSREGRARSYQLAEVPWVEAARILAAHDSRLIVPVGALSQHGPHLPLGTKTIIAEKIARRLSEQLGILCAPVFAYGVPTRADKGFPGTAGLRRKTLHRSINELLARWEDHGVSEFVILTAYRHEPHLEALLMALTAESVTTVIDLYAIDVSDIVESAPEAELAGELETSLLLHLAPELVRLDRLSDAPLEPEQYRKYLRGTVPRPPPGSYGTVGRPSLASAEKGRRLCERYLEILRETLARDARAE